MKYIRLISAVLVTLLSIVVIAGCATSQEQLNTDLPPLKFFQLAQEAYDNKNYELALEYYNTFIEEYPEEKAKKIEARYEIAFIHYKLDHYQKAKELFQGILDTYSSAASGEYPEWPKILSEKLITKIEEAGSSES